MANMPTLNLPQFDIKIKIQDDKHFVFDIIRKKYFLLTPEEWIRQNFLHFLILNYKYPKSLIRIESGLKYNKLSKRSDILIYDRTGTPFLLVECKSSDVKIAQHSFEQAAMYNYTLKAKYMVLTNGQKHYCCKIDHEAKSYEFVKDIPLWI
jgi:hypothetical protein